MAPVAHSRLGASSAARWMNCPGSVALLATLPTPPGSVYAEEGTRAHSWAELMLTQGERDASRLVGADGEIGATLSADMAKHLQVYLDTFWQLADKPGAIWNVEKKFQLTDIDPECFGTNDASVYTPDDGTLYVLDLKYGAGRSVFPAHNPQLLYYAYGAYTSYLEYPIHRIVLIIVQPRTADEAVRQWECDPFYLVDWAMSLRTKVHETRKPNAPLNPGKWCDKTFCAARATCPALKAVVESQAAEGFKAVDLSALATMSRDALAEALERADMLETWIKAIRDYATAEAAAGRAPTGWKMVAGMGRRSWKGEVAEAEIAAAIQKITNSVDPWQRSLISAPQAEKALGKRNFEALKDLVTVKVGPPKLARATDKRPEWNPADGFTPVTTEDI